MVEVTKIRDADMEDLFDAHFYLQIVNEVYRHVLPNDLTMKTINDANPRIAQRIQKFFEKEGIADGFFDTYRPAAYLLQKHIELRTEIDDATIERAASMFERINSLLPTNGSTNGAAQHAMGNGAAMNSNWAYGSSRQRTATPA